MFIDNFENYHFISKTCYWILLLFAPFNLVDQLKKLGISFLVTEPDFCKYFFLAQPTLVVDLNLLC